MDLLTSVWYYQLEQAVVKEMAWFRDTALSLEKLKTINLDPEVIAEQLYEQKVRTIYKYEQLITFENISTRIYQCRTL